MNIPITDLSAPFPPDQVKQRRGNFGQQLSYVETASVIARLNDALDGQWSFTIHSMDVEPDVVVVRGRLTIGNTHREQYGSSRITRHRDSGEVVNIGDDLKSAASDCLKKCATLAGVGSYLYHDGGHGKTNGNGHSGRRHTASRDGGSTSQTTSNGHAGNGNGHSNAHTEADRVSNTTIADLLQATKQAGLAQKDLINLARETYDATLSQLTPAQADDLLAMIAA